MTKVLLAGMPMNISRSSVFAPFVALALMLVVGPAHATTGIDDMFANFGTSAVSIMKMVVNAGFLMGLLVSFSAAMKFKEYSESGGRTQLKTPLTFLAVGVALVALPGTINVATETMSLGQNTATSVFSVGGGGADIPGMDSAIKGVLLFVKMVGHIALIRGLLILKRVGEGAQGADIGRGLTHIFGGAAAININATVSILANSVGFSL